MTPAQSANPTERSAENDDKLTRRFVVSGQNRNVIINESGLYALYFPAQSEDGVTIRDSIGRDKTVIIINERTRVSRNAIPLEEPSI